MEIVNFTPAIFVQGNQPSSDEPAGCACDQTGATHVYLDSCDARKEVTVVAKSEDSALDHVLDVAVTLQNVCPGRQSALGIHLSEMDEEGAEHACGFRAVSIPAHSSAYAKDVQLDAVRFVLPEDRIARKRRHLIVRTTHHYLDM